MLTSHEKGSRNLYEAATQSQGQQSRHGSKHRGLPEMTRQGSKSRWDHGVLSFLASSRSIFSASFTSSKVSFPDLTKCAITGFARPPSKATSSSIRVPCASSREIVASKMSALLILFARRTTFLLVSMRYTG